MRRSVRPAVALCALLLLAMPAVAVAGPRERIIADCADDGRIDGTYRPADLRDARRNLPTEIAEYTDCADQIRRAELAGLESTARPGGDGQPGAGTGDAPPAGPPAVPLGPASDAERASLADAVRVAAPVTVRGASVVPGAAGFSPGAPSNEMPVSLLLAVAGLALLGLGALSRRLWRARM